MENQVVGHAGAVAAWEWLMPNSLAILTWLKTDLRNKLSAGPRAPFADRANRMKKAFGNCPTGYMEQAPSRGHRTRGDS